MADWDGIHGHLHIYRPAPPNFILINEIDALTLSGDTREFVELFDGGTGNTPLDGNVIVFFDGATDTSYHAIDLDGLSTDANGYLVIGNSGVSNVDFVIADGTLRNGVGVSASDDNTSITTPTISGGKAPDGAEIRLNIRAASGIDSLKADVGQILLKVK